MATLIFLFVSGSWWNEVFRLWWGPRTSSSVSDVHVKLKISQSIVPAVYILSILFLLTVAAVLPALLRVDSYLSESTVVLLNFLTMAASLTALVVETRLKKFQIIVGLDALATRRAFVRYISHEVRTPLNIISLGLDLLEDELKEDDSNELNINYIAGVQQVQDSCRVAVGIMNDLIQVILLPVALLYTPHKCNLRIYTVPPRPTTPHYTTPHPTTLHYTPTPPLTGSIHLPSLQYDSVQDGDIELNTSTVQGVSMMREVIRPIKAQAEQLGVTLSCNFLAPGPSHSSSMEHRGPVTPRPGNQDMLASIVSSQQRGAISHSASSAQHVHDLDVISKVDSVSIEPNHNHNTPPHPYPTHIRPLSEPTSIHASYS